MDDEFNYPHSKQTKPLIIFGGSMHGKSTAHNKGLGHDIESPPPNGYSEWSEKYEEFSAAEDTWKVTRDKSKLKARGKAYNDMAREAVRSDIPVLFAHYNKDVEKMAEDNGREVRLVLID